MTDTAPMSDTPGTADGEAVVRHVRVAYPAPAPASAAPATALDGVALVTLDRPATLNALSFDLLDQLVEALGQETDLIMATTMRFDDRTALDAGLGSDAMRAAGRNLREIAPGLATLYVLEDLPDMTAAASRGVDTV